MLHIIWDIVLLRDGISRSLIKGGHFEVWISKLFLKRDDTLIKHQQGITLA